MTNKKNKKLLITTEHAGLFSSGGIGTYVNEYHKVNPNILILVIGTSKIDKAYKNIFFDYELLEKEELKDIDAEDVAYQCFKKLNEEYSFSELEVQDYRGIGARIAQAKKTGLFPNDFKLKVVSHGAMFHLNKAYRKIIQFDMRVLELERTTLELADEVLMPTQFILNSYLDLGIKLNQTKIKRLPFDIRGNKTLEKRENFDGDIIVIGNAGKLIKTGVAKKIISSLKANPLIKSITFYGVSQVEGMSELSNSAHFDINFKLVAHNVLLDILKEKAAKSLVVLPYFYDNHPYSLLEAISCGIGFYAFDYGGIRELIDYKEHRGIVTEDNFYEELKHLNLEKIKELQEDSIKNQSLFFDKQKEINNEYLSIEKGSSFAKREQMTLTVGIPIFNTPFDLLKKTFTSIKEQTISPQKLVIVDDGSEDSYSDKLKKLCEDYFKDNYTYVKQENQGLSKARNKAFTYCDTDLFIALDSDDIYYPNYLEFLKKAHELNPDVAVVGSYLRFAYFDERKEIKDRLFRPWGNMGVIHGLCVNRFAQAFSMIKSSWIQQVNGWAGERKDMWEDWNFYLRLRAKGADFLIIPEVLVDYSVHKNSMSVNYEQFRGKQLMIEALSESLPRWEVESLYSLITDHQEESTYLGLLKKMIKLFVEKNRIHLKFLQGNKFIVGIYRRLVK